MKEVLYYLFGYLSPTVWKYSSDSYTEHKGQAIPRQDGLSDIQNIKTSRKTFSVFVKQRLRSNFSTHKKGIS